MIKQDLEELEISYISKAEHYFFRTNDLTSGVRSMLKSLNILRPKLVQGLEKLSKAKTR
jgi:hypothetical protein